MKCVSALFVLGWINTIEAMKIGTVLKNLRVSRGATLEEIALEANTDVGNLSRIERGLQAPSIEAVEQIAAALQIRMSALFLMIEGEGASAELPEDGVLQLTRGFRALAPENKKLLLDFVALLKRHQSS